MALSWGGLSPLTTGLFGLIRGRSLYVPIPRRVFLCDGRGDPRRRADGAQRERRVGNLDDEGISMLVVTSPNGQDKRLRWHLEQALEEVVRHLKLGYPVGVDPLNEFSDLGVTAHGGPPCCDPGRDASARPATCTWPAPIQGDARYRSHPSTGHWR